MKLFKVFLFVLLTATGIALLPHTAASQVNEDIMGGIGLGALLGEPTGATVKYWMGDYSAFDIGAAWSLSGSNEALHMHSDFLWHTWFEDNENVAFYYGIGGRVIFADDAKLGLRVPVGLTYVFDGIPLDLFLEAAPILDVAPDVNFAGNGGVGLRYYL